MEVMEATGEVSLSRVGVVPIWLKQHVLACHKLLAQFFLDQMKTGFHLLSLLVCLQLTGLSNLWHKYFQYTKEKMGSQEAVKTVLAGMATIPTLL